MKESFYDFKAKDINGNEVSMSSYDGKVVLIVNVASSCGFTPQYEGLQKLYNVYKEQGLEILAFPCNQFGEQEKGGEEEINVKITNDTKHCRSYSFTPSKLG